MATRTRKSPGGISDEAVKKATGCDWAAWIVCLDKSGCAGMSHKEIAELVHRRWPRIGGWWSQMVTVGYEQAKGLRARNQVKGGWSVSSSRTVAAPVRALFGAFKDPKQRARWLAHPRFTVRKATAPKSMRITWVDGRTNVDVGFYKKGAKKSMVALQHDKLPGKKDVARMRAYWSKALGKLKAQLEA